MLKIQFQFSGAHFFCSSSGRAASAPHESKAWWGAATHSGAVLQVISQFDKDFQEQSDDIIFQTILAANFLDIKNLLELMCKKVADEIKKCKTPDDIRDR